MANIFFAGDKLPKQEAINTLTVEISNYFNGRYEVTATSDDGGSLLEVVVEVPDPSSPILEQFEEFPLRTVIPKWAGWRCTVMKVGVGYIDTILNAPELDDY